MTEYVEKTLPRMKRLSGKEKAKVLKGIVDDAYDYAKKQILDNRENSK